MHAVLTHPLYIRIVSWRGITVGLLLAVYLGFQFILPKKEILSVPQLALLGLILIETALTISYFAIGARLRGQLVPPILYVIQFGIDVLLLLALLYLTGGIFSNFWVLFAFVTVSASGVLPRNMAAPFMLISLAAPPTFAAAEWFAFGFKAFEIAHSVENLQIVVSKAAYTSGFLFLGSLFAQYLSKSIRSTQFQLRESDARVQELSKLYELIVKSIPSGVILLDTNYNVLTSNQAAKDILGDQTGIAIEKIMERPVLDPDARPQVRLTRDEAIQILGYSVVRLQPQNPSDPTAPRTMIVFQDLTEVSSLEQKLRSEEKLAAVGRLGANLAHEIGNPLAAISNVVQLLQRNQRDAMQREELLSVANRETERLQLLLKNFLSITRSNTKQDRSYELFRPLDILRSTRDSLRVQFPRVSIETTGDDTEVFGSKHALEQIVYNLMLNAAQWVSSDQGKVEASVKIAAELVIVRMQDNGPGIPEDMRDSIWEPFVTGRTDGTGLGLALVAQLLQELGGSFVLENTERTGTNIVVEFPVGKLAQ